MTTKYNNLLNNIKKIAHNKGMTLADINKQAGLGKAYIYTWREHNPSPKNIRKVAEILHVSAHELIHGYQSEGTNDQSNLLIFNNIKRIAKDKKISISRLSQLCGLSQNIVYEWRYSNPTFDNLRKIANALRVPIVDIISNPNDIDNDDYNKTLKVDLNDYQVIFTYYNKRIPSKYLQLIRQLLNTWLIDEY